MWKQLWSDGDRWAGVELAKHYEHKMRDFVQAETTTTDLLRDVGDDDEREALEHRLSRIQRKRRGKKKPTREETPENSPVR